MLYLCSLEPTDWRVQDDGGTFAFLLAFFWEILKGFEMTLEFAEEKAHKCPTCVIITEASP